MPRGSCYDDLDINFGHLDNENLSTRRLETLSVIGDSLVATVELDAEISTNSRGCWSYRHHSVFSAC